MLMGFISKSVYEVANSIKAAGKKSVGFVLGSIFGDDENREKEKLPVFPEWFFSARLGQPRRANLLEIRSFAQSPWCQMAINTIKKEVAQVPYEIFIDNPKNPKDDIKNYSEDVRKIEQFFEKVNSNGEDIYDIIKTAITDIAEIDGGVWTKVYTESSYTMEEVEMVDELNKPMGKKEIKVLKPFGQRELVGLWYGDGATFLFDIDAFRRVRGFWQYSFMNPKIMPLFFWKDEVCYFQMNRRSYSLYGFSPVMSAQQEIELMIQSTRYNKDFFTKNMIPDGMVGVEDADEDSLKRLKTDWAQKVQGKPHKLMFVNSKINLEQFNRTNQEMQWLDGQKWYYHLILAQFGLSPAEVGFHEDVNRSTQEGQERVTVRNAIKPYLDTFQKKINADIIPEILQKENPVLKWRFVPEDHVAEKVKFDQDMQELNAGTMTINEYRRERGREDVDWGDKPKEQQKIEIDQSRFGSNPPEDEDKKPQPKDDKDKGKKKIKEKSKEISEGQDVVDESKSYDEFIVKNMESWEDAALKAVEKVDKIYAENGIRYTKKTFGEFLQTLFSGIKSSPFINGVKKFIRQSMKDGLQAAEADLDMQIGASFQFKDRVEALANQELNGYTVHGRKWHGIKGVTHDLQVKILNSVSEGVQKKESREELKARVKDIFKSAKEAQAERIARTETTRFINEGKLQAFKDSGVKGNKTWNAVIDEGTSEICKELSKKYGVVGVPFDQPFVDKQGREYHYPPAHPHCRSVIGYALPGGENEDPQ